MIANRLGLRASLALASALACASFCSPLAAQSGLTVTYGAKGVQTLSFLGRTLEDVGANPADAFHIWHMQATDLNGNALNCAQCGWGENNNGESWNPATLTETYAFSWGSISVQFGQSGNTLNLLVTETNNANSGLVLNGAQIYPFALHFPQDPAGFNGYSQYLPTTTGPAVSPADYGSGVVTSVLPNESQSLYGGWQNVGNATYAPMMSTTSPDGLPTFLPAINLPVQPGSSVSYTMSLRFTPEGTAANATDAYSSFAATYPSQMTWTDKRILGTAYLASSPNGNVNQPGGFPTNPRRYFNDPSVDITTPAGLKAFQNRMLAQAQANVTNAKAMNAQGVITWDVEGEQYPQNTSYVCSPDQIAAVAPEMESVITDASSPYAGQKLDDSYFQVMSSAGLRVGVCLRPQVFTLGANSTASQVFLTGNSTIVSNLENKARYANSRWGVTVFYVDSTVDPNGGTLDPAIFQQLITDLPSFLFIPEEHTPRYYAYTAPFYSFIDLGVTGTPASTYLFYPKAFGANLINDVAAQTLAAAEPAIIQSVTAGDILMGHADWAQPNDPTLVAIYAAAGVKPTNPTQVTPTLSWAPPGSLVYGNALSAAQLNATANVPGTFTYSPAAGTVLPAGTTSLTASFTPADATDYSSASASVPLQVTQATPTITWPTPANIVSGSALSAVQLDATANVPGSFTYSPSAGTVPAAGTITLQATFTPTDSADYASATASVPLTVTKVNQTTPTITWPAPAAISYGTALSSAQLDASANVAGTFTYSPAAGTVPGVGTIILQTSFTPSNTTSYTSASATTSLQVLKATPQITWPAPAALSSGTALSSAQLNAVTNVPGTFTYSPAAGTVPPTGTTTLTVTFTPVDSTDYTTAQATVPLTVNAASNGPVAIVSPASGATVSGTVVVVAQVQVNLDAAGSHLLVDGAAYGGSSFGPFVYTLNTTALTNGQHKLQVWAHDTGNNTDISAPVVITVANGSSTTTPTLTWPTPAAIGYGTALGGAQLDAASSVPGTFAYNPAPGTVLTAGSHTLQVTFTPANSGSYSTASASTTIQVAQATPQLSWAAPASITAGTALSAVQLNASANVPGTFTYAPGPGTALAPGTSTLNAVFTPSDSTDYSTQSISVELTVNPATTTAAPSPVAAPTGPLAILTPLSGASVSGTVNVLGLCTLALDAGGSHLLVDGAAYGGNIFGPFVYSLDTTTLPNGTHTLQLWGHDIGNNTTLSPAVTIVVAN